MRIVTWKMCEKNIWCHLNFICLNNLDFGGVYIIWNQNGLTTEILKVGSGNIKNRLSEHQNCNNYKGSNVYCTWAKIDSQDVYEGIESFLGKNLIKDITKRFPDVTPITVNLPDFSNMDYYFQ